MIKDAVPYKAAAQRIMGMMSVLLRTSEIGRVRSIARLTCAMSMQYWACDSNSNMPHYPILHHFRILHSLARQSANHPMFRLPFIASLLPPLYSLAPGTSFQLRFLGKKIIYKKKPPEIPADARLGALKSVQEHNSEFLIPFGENNVQFDVQKCGNPRCSSAGLNWCQFPVTFPARDWQKVLNFPPRQMTHLVDELTEGEKYILPEGIKLFVVNRPDGVDQAISLLVNSMKDPVIALDMEWRFDTTHVGVIQLATPSICVLLRPTLAWKKHLPRSMVALFTHPQVVIVGFSWNITDERKMQISFNWGRKDFRHFIDLQELGRTLGYGNLVGMRRLVRRTLGYDLAKDIKIIRSNWETRRLGPTQILYAALDAFALGQAFRQWRYWHANPMSECRTCGNILGGVFDDVWFPCATLSCTKAFQDIQGYKMHCEIQDHKYIEPLCLGCGRILPKREGFMPDPLHAQENLILEPVRKEVEYTRHGELGTTKKKKIDLNAKRVDTGFRIDLDMEVSGDEEEPHDLPENLKYGYMDDEEEGEIIDLDFVKPPKRKHRRRPKKRKRPAFDANKFLTGQMH